jgi:Raf kinase inhibitor-like YbhB/YbcL family protein
MRPDPYAKLAAVPAFQASSDVVADEVTMPVAQRGGIFNAGGQDVSPDLRWSGFPDPTRSFIVTMYDPDAPTPSGFWHWAIVDLPSDTRSLPEGAGESDDALPAGRHITNDAGMRRYIGPAPPPGPAHRYYIVVTRSVTQSRARLSSRSTGGSLQRRPGQRRARSQRCPT